MKSECILSAGIDIGTTTTHLILSRIGISVTGGFGTVPAVQITSKEIVYKSPVYFTPLFSNGEINGAAVAKIIEREYKAAGICAADLKSGAVIITGESACKGNSAEVLQDIAALSGDFVAAQAGSELESYLSGKGAEAEQIRSANRPEKPLPILMSAAEQRIFPYFETENVWILAVCISAAGLCKQRAAGFCWLTV